MKFPADILPAFRGTPLAAGGGDPGKAFTKCLGAIGKRNWPDVKAGLSPKILPMYKQDYNTPAETRSSARPGFDQTQPVGWGRPPNFVIIFIGPRGNRS